MTTDAAIRHRDPSLVYAILGYIADEAGEPVAWSEVVDMFTGELTAAKTVENILHELARFGAMQRIGEYKPGRDTRAVRLTILGDAWLQQIQEPPLPPRTETP